MPTACPHCASVLLQPLRWTPDRARMRCPECQSCFEAEASPAVLRELEDEQARARAALVAAHERMVGESMQALTVTFRAALERDLLGPDDF